MATTMPPLPQGAGSQGKDGLSRMLMIGTSIFGGGSAVFLIVQVIREEPEKAFKLLTAWGPGYLLAFFIAFLVDRLMCKVMEGARSSSEMGALAVRDVAVEMRSIAEAANRQASAMQEMAQKDDRDKQEMQTLIGVVNSKIDQSLEEMKRQNRAFERIENALNINTPGESGTK
jgi:hypothetical protein